MIMYLKNKYQMDKNCTMINKLNCKDQRIRWLIFKE